MRSRSKRFSIAALVLTIGALAIAPGAFGANSSVKTYSGGGGNVQTQVASGDPSEPSAPAPDSGSLPFTGFDIGLAFGGGLLLLGLGASVATLNRRTGAETR